MSILLLSEKYIKDNSILDENLTSKVIKITLKQVQDFKLQPILGQDKYEEVIAEYTKYSQDKNYTIDADLVKLKKEYVNDFLIYSVLHEITTPLNYKFTNKGTLSITDANAENINLGEIESVKKYYKVKADAYRQRLIEHLNDGHTPLGTVSYNTGFYLKNDLNYERIAKAKANKTGYKGWRG